MIKPGKVACAGLVVILMVLPNTLWKTISARTHVRVVDDSPRRGGDGPGPHAGD